MQRKATADKRS